MTREEVIHKYDELLSHCPNIDRKGKSMPYTSANGHMFSQINKAGELGMRFSKEVQKAYIEKYKTEIFTSYGAEMRGYVLIPGNLWDNMETLVTLLNESHQYVLSLDPK